MRSSCSPFVCFHTSGCKCMLEAHMMGHSSFPFFLLTVHRRVPHCRAVARCCREQPCEEWCGCALRGRSLSSFPVTLHVATCLFCFPRHTTVLHPTPRGILSGSGSPGLEPRPEEHNSGNTVKGIRHVSECTSWLCPRLLSLVVFCPPPAPPAISGTGREGPAHLSLWLLAGGDSGLMGAQ